jgi:hypothetical protein
MGLSNDKVEQARQSYIVGRQIAADRDQAHLDRERLIAHGVPAGLMTRMVVPSSGAMMLTDMAIPTSGAMVMTNMASTTSGAFSGDDGLQTYMAMPSSGIAPSGPRQKNETLLQQRRREYEEMKGIRR